MKVNLETQFCSVLNELNFSEIEIQNHWAYLSKAYSKSSRHYHNLEHLEDMIRNFFHYQKEIESPIEMQLAIFYHDVIYKVTRKDNEEKSAELAMEIFTKTKINSNILNEMIMSTKFHDAKTSDEKWMVDFDLAILGKSWSEYEEYTKKIRKEYKIYPDLLYKPGRKKVLLHFLEKERIYLTEEFFHQFEKSARSNIEREIKNLS